jgi:pimeloyl-ACP methyl ester carboxylesterase
VAALAATGCGLRTLRRNLALAQQQSSVDGQVEIRGGLSEPVVVVAERVDTGQIADLFVLARPGPFFMTLAPGRYRMAAFADRDRNLRYDPPGDPAVLLDPSGEVVLAPGERRSGVKLVIDPEAGVVLPFAVTGATPARALERIPSLQIGAIASLDDPRFAPDFGSLGLWDPIRFMLEAGAGVYFLEPYDPNKIPILFVHGATGSPANWKYLASRIDRTRFQAWFAYYPAAPNLDRVGEQILRALSSLQVKYRFPRLVLVAHSMGGLVTRAALNYVSGHLGTGRLVQVPVFVSISSPWGGIESADLGVKYAPVVAPMWQDMAPASTFLANLPKTPLPPETEFDLFFSYASDSRLNAQANDGTVTVASELSMPIQLQAKRVLGFERTHVSILDAPEVADQLNDILARVPR